MYTICCSHSCFVSLNYFINLHSFLHPIVPSPTSLISLISFLLYHSHLAVHFKHFFTSFCSCTLTQFSSQLLPSFPHSFILKVILKLLNTHSLLENIFCTHCGVGYGKEQEHAQKSFNSGFPQFSSSTSSQHGR